MSKANFTAASGSEADGAMVPGALARGAMKATCRSCIADQQFIHALPFFNLEF